MVVLGAACTKADEMSLSVAEASMATQAPVTPSQGLEPPPQAASRKRVARQTSESGLRMFGTLLAGQKVRAPRPEPGQGCGFGGLRRARPLPGMVDHKQADRAARRSRR